MNVNEKEIYSKVRDLKSGIHKYIQELSEVYEKEDDSDVPSISITPAASTSSSHEFSESNVRVSVIPEAKKNLVRVHQVKIMDDSVNELKSATVVNLERVKSAENASVLSTSRNSLNEDTESLRKVTRTPSNGTKRKVKLRRMGSRQNSKSESETDDEPPNFVFDIPRKCKRKTSRAKKSSDNDKTQAADVYVVKTKDSPKTSDRSVTPKEETVINSQTEMMIPQPVIDRFNDNDQYVSCDIFVKTHRTLFGPVDKNDNETSIEGPTSDANVIVNTDEKQSTQDDSKILSLPPLPQSPVHQRKVYEAQKSQTKELSPSIQLMIQKYNKRLSAERSNTSPLSSGSCSPVAWRSPILERRVRAQTQKYEEKVYSIMKSSSAGHLENTFTTSVTKTNSGNEKDRHVKKSHSAGTIEAPTFKIVNILKPHTPDPINVAPEKKERQYKKHTDIQPAIAQKSGAIRKITAMQQKDDPLYKRRLSSESSQPNPSDNMQPKITRKYENRAPTPLSFYKTDSASFDSNPNLSSSPTTPTSLVPDSKTQFSDRALKLLKAKEEFFSSHKDNPLKQEVWHNRLSQISADNVSIHNECGLTKSASVGIIGQSETTSSNNQNTSGHASLPRNSKPPADVEYANRDEQQKSNKSSRFGLSNIASKFRKVKLRKNSKDLTNMNAVSALCRQSLMVDISRQHNLDLNSGVDKRVSTSQSPLPLQPSSSTSSGLFRFRRHDKQEKLRKSKSVGAVQEETDC